MGIFRTLKEQRTHWRLDVFHHCLMHVSSLGYITVRLSSISPSQKKFYHIAPQLIDVHQMTADYYCGQNQRLIVTASHTYHVQ